MDAPTTIIRPRRGWSDVGARDVWAYRELVWFLAWRNIKGRYRQMALGPLWIVIQPLVTMLLFTLVFNRIAGIDAGNVPYPIFAYSGLLPWTFFSTATNGASGSLVSQIHVISKVYFPRLTMPISVVISALVDLLFTAIPYSALFVFYGVSFPLRLPEVVIYLALTAITALTVGLWTAALAVRFRDVSFIVRYALQAWMYLTPVAYPADQFPEQLLWLQRLNPMFWAVEGFRSTLLSTPPPSRLGTLAALSLMTLALWSGALIFRRTERTVVDLL